MTTNGKTIKDLDGQVNLTDVETMIKDGTFKIVTYAKSIKVNVGDLSQYIKDKFGNKIIIRRGRYGGVFWNNVK